MASYFVDSSALAKLYHPEVGTQAMDRIAVAAETEINISRLTLVEIPSVFAIKVRTNFITSEDAALVLLDFTRILLRGSSPLSQSGSRNLRWQNF